MLVSGKVVLLTGASSGIGKETALELARQGCDLTIICHTWQKAQDTREEIARRSGSTKVTALSADLSRMSETRRVASEFAAAHDRLDVLLNNAGSNFPTFERTEDGFERTMALNYFSPFLLTQRLLPLLRSSAPSRIVNVASVAHYSGRLDLAKLTDDPQIGTGGLGAYSRSKLALVLFTLELARRLEGTKVTANCLHPGAVRTHIWYHAGGFTPLTLFASLFMRSPKKGARTSIYLATSPDVAATSGKYFANRRERTPSERARDPELARQLWEESLRLTERREGG